MKFSWQVTLSDDSIETGIAENFADAIQALKNWYGDGAVKDLSYIILPVPA